jgi:hypothetical protein
MFAVDIDGTIAEGQPAALLDYFRETCCLALVDVPEDITWWDIFDLPEVVAYMSDKKKGKEQEEKEKRQLQDDLDWAESVMNTPKGKYKLKDTDPLQKA